MRYALFRMITCSALYSGESASVFFVEGVGETDDPHLIEWFKSKGYAIEDEPEPVKEPDDKPDDKPSGEDKPKQGKK